MSARLSGYAPAMLSVLRIMAALIFLEHGAQKLFGFPPGSTMPRPEMMSMIWFAGLIELIPGALIAMGLFTRAAAFIAAGEMAVAYFIGHAARGGFFPANNGGDAAILYCFIFLYLVCAGAGPWSLDAMRGAARGTGSDGDDSVGNATQA
jgi:putative oxidoreductase